MFIIIVKHFLISKALNAKKLDLQVKEEMQET
jgi:hypothetical protein